MINGGDDAAIVFDQSAVDAGAGASATERMLHHRHSVQDVDGNAVTGWGEDPGDLIVDELHGDGPDLSVASGPGLPTGAAEAAAAERKAAIDKQEAERSEAYARADAERFRERSAGRQTRLYAFWKWIQSWSMLPSRLFETSMEEGRKYPPWVYTLEYSWRRWGRAIAVALSVASVLVSLVLGVRSFFSSTSRPMYDGVVVENIWEPMTHYNYDLSSSQVTTWLQDHKEEAIPLSNSDTRVGYFQAHVLTKDAWYNVTIEWIFEAMRHACGHDPTHKDDSACDCLPAIEIGILANVIYADETLMIDPHITEASLEKVPIIYDDGTRARQPASIRVKYMHQDGLFDVKEVVMQEAFCIMRSIELVGHGLH